MNIDLNKESTYQENMECDPPIVNHDFIEELGTKESSRRSFMTWERVAHSHGATYQEVYALANGKFEKCVDMIVYPGSSENVEHLVKMAHKHNVVLVPYGGGTNVT